MPKEEEKNEEGKKEELTEEKVTETEDETKVESTELSEKEKKAISESRKYQNRAQKAEKELEKIREEKLSDDEKKDLKIKKLEEDKLEADRKVRDSNVDSMIMGYASTLGFQDLEVVKLIALKELADEDEISEEDVKSVIDSIAKDKKYLLGGEDTTKVGAGNFEGGQKKEEEKTADEMMKDTILKGANF